MKETRPHLRPGLWLAMMLLAATPVLHGSTLNFDPDWKFLKADPPGAQAEAYDDSTWTTVSAPHTFNDTDTFDHFNVGGHTGEIAQWSGLTWYRKTFTTPDAWKGREVCLEFEAVRQIAEVYLNGHDLGRSENGFLPFGFDLTPWLHFDGRPNVLAVHCDNRFGKDSPIPWNDPHWHPAHGGLYRNVYLHVLDPVHFTLPLYSNLGTVGIYNYADHLQRASAEVHAEAEVQNQTAHPVAVTYRGELRDPTGRIVLTLHAAATLAPGQKSVLLASGTFLHPCRWSPVYPYLYTLHSLLLSGDTVRDETDTPLGIRAAQWTLDEGLFLNGTHVKLHGWGQRPTDEWPGLGAAMPDWLHDYTLQLMKDAGGNFIRWGHCAGPPAALRASDRLGLITEQPGVDGEHDATGHAWDIRVAAFRDLLVYDRNHPSILIWEGGNQSVSEDHVRTLTALVRQYDPHGGRVYGHRRADAITEKYSQIAIGTEGQLSSRLPTVEGEYDREESPRRVWDNDSPPDYGYLAGRGQTYDLTSEQYAVNQVTQYMTKIGLPSHTGGANWIFSDTTSGGRDTGEVDRASGEVDGVRLPKEAYYVCQAMFRSDPQVHLIGHWTYPPDRHVVKTVYVASNADRVDLLLNGHNLGNGHRTDTYLFTFPNITWQPGTLQARAWNHGRLVKTDRLETAGPAALRLTPRVSPLGFRATGSDIALVDVEAIDAQGRRCPTWQQRVDFTLTGPAQWRGGYNSGKIDTINHPWLDLEAGINRIALKSRLQPGPVVLTATAAGLPPATLRLVSQPVPLHYGATPQLPPDLPVPPLDPADAPPLGPGPSLHANDPLPVRNEGRYTAAFAYTGPTPGARIVPNARNGEPAYSGGDTTFTALPAFLTGADYAQLPPADAAYSAVDLISITARDPATLYLAHDQLLAPPPWLTSQFQPLPTPLTLAGHSYILYQRPLTAGATCTLGGNAENVPPSPTAAMYLLFLQKK